MLKKIIFVGLYFFIIHASALTNSETDSPYRQAGHFIFISSQVPINPITQKLVSADPNKQVKQVLDNVQTEVIASGANMTDVIKITVYMNDIDTVFPIVKQYIPQYFSKPPYPARSPIGGVSFGQTGFKVAIDAIAYVK